MGAVFVCFLTLLWVEQWNYGTTTADSKSDNNILLGIAPFEFRVLTRPLDTKTLIEERSATYDHLKILNIDIQEDESKCSVS